MKKLIIALSTIFCTIMIMVSIYTSVPRNQPQPENKTVVEKTVKTGISFGTCLAMIISYTAWKSIGWAILHGLFSWFYVIYYIIKY